MEVRKGASSINLSDAFYCAGSECPELVITGSDDAAGHEGQDGFSIFTEEQLFDEIKKYKKLLCNMGPKLKDKGENIKKILKKLEQELDARKLQPEKASSSPSMACFDANQPLDRARGLQPTVSGKKQVAAFTTEIETFKGELCNGNRQFQGRLKSDSNGSASQLFTSKSADVEGKKGKKLQSPARHLDKKKDYCPARTPPAVRRPTSKDNSGQSLGNSNQSEKCSWGGNKKKECGNTPRKQPSNGQHGSLNNTSMQKRRRGTTLDTAMELSDDEEKGALTEVASSSPAHHPYQLRRDALGKGDYSITYPRDDPEAVEIRQSEMRHLNDSEFLNDTVIDFYIRYIQKEGRVTDDKRNMFHFFNTFFFKKLLLEKKEGEYFSKLQKWTRGINIFQKKYLFVPIHDSAHWSLSIICFGKESEGREFLKPYILHLDSMREGHSSDNIFSHLRSYLQDEWNHSKANGDIAGCLHIDFEQTLPKRVEVPQQPNAWDCGLFLLFFIQCFVRDAPEEFDRDSLKTMFGRRWFKPHEASALRSSIKKLLTGFFKKAKAHIINEVVMEDMD